MWRKEYAPHSPEEIFHPRFVEALQKQDQVEYLLDVLLFGETEEKAALITDYGKDVIQLEQRMAELAAADAARTKKHHERHAAAPPLFRILLTNRARLYPLAFPVSIS